MNVYLVLFILYMLAPKVDLQLVPVRPEDIISLIAIAIYLFTRNRHPIRLTRPILFYLAFIGANFVSSILNIGSFGVTGLLYSARLVQYLMWYFILYEACQDIDWKTMRRGFMIMSVVLMGWGFLELIDVVQPPGLFAGAEGRLTINTTGPYETSVVLAILAYSLANVAFALPLLIMVMLTQARITVVGLVFSYVSVKPVRAALMAAAAFLIYSAVAQPLVSSVLQTRAAETETPERMGRVVYLSWQRAPILEDPSFFRERLLAGPTIFRYMVDTDGDLSFRYRAVRWPTVIKTTLNSSVHMMIGWAPGSWGLALDNYYVRVFGETGLIGLALFGLWLGTTILSLDLRGTARFALVMMGVVALFIDIFTSSKVMPLVWAFLAFEHSRHPFAIPQTGREGNGRLSRWVGQARGQPVPELAGGAVNSAEEADPRGKA